MPRNPPQILPQPLPIPQLNRLGSLQHIEYPGPSALLGRRIPPRVVRAPLHRHIAPLQHPRLPTVQNQLNLSLNDNSQIQRQRPVHRRGVAGREVDDAPDATAGDGDARRVGEVGDVGGDVGLVGHLDRLGGGGVHEGEIHGVVHDAFGGDGGGDLVGEDGRAQGGVRGDVPG